MNNGIELEYNGGTVHVHPLSWVPLEELPGARILAELDKDAEIFIKAMFRVVVKVDSDDFDDDNDGDKYNNNRGAIIRPQLRDSHFKTLFADYHPLSFDMKMLCEDIREHVQDCAFEAMGRNRAMYLQLAENEEIVCAIDHLPDARAAQLEEVLKEGTDVNQRTIFCDVSFPGYNVRGRQSAAAANLTRPSFYERLPVV